MKNKLFAFLCVLLAFACGAPGEGAPEIILGKNEQAIYLPFGYGTEIGDKSACDGNWSGGACDAPDFRATGLALMTNTCDAEFAGYMRKAAERWKSFMTGVGWKVAYKELQHPVVSSEQTNISIRCANGGSDYGVTSVGVTPSWVPIFGDYECHDASLGEFCQFQGSGTDIFVQRIKAHQAWAGATAAKKENLVVNIMQHELYHSMGLGHRVNAALGSELMAVSIPPTGSSSNFWTIKLAPNADQRLQMACYNPRSGTQPDSNPSCPL